MHDRLTSLEDFAADGLIGRDDVAGLADVADLYAIALTRQVAGLIDRTDTHDPIAAQYVPTPGERNVAARERSDPIGDKAHSPVPGLVHRYPDRVLLKAASVCPVYCRFCFRRAMVGPENGEPLSEADLECALAYIAHMPEVFEVIVTGGDPLMLSSRRIGRIGEALRTIDHVKIVRWHTRVPMVAAQLIDEARIAALKTAGKPVYVAVHANHAREFSSDARAALSRLADAGLVLVGQSVLLRGVNDEIETLADLMRAFVTNRVMPYYIHHLDPAPGTSHFRVPLERGQELVRQLRGHLSGLCQPTFVVDIPGGGGKVNASPSDVEIGADGRVVLTDRHGEKHRYGVADDGAAPPAAEARQREPAAD